MMQHRRTLLARWLPRAVAVGVTACLLMVHPHAACGQGGEAPLVAESSAASEESSPAENAEPAAGEDVARDQKLPKLDEMLLPTAEQLLREPPVDWVVLKYQQQVIVAEPVMPRPDTLQKLQAAYDEKQQQRTRMSGEALKKYREDLELLTKLRLRLPDQPDEADYLLPYKLVEQIIHHEDLVLRRIDVLIGDKQFDLAYELLNILRRSTPDWPGAVDRHNALLFAEAGRKIDREQFEAALAALVAIHARSPQYPGLSERTGFAADRLIGRAVAENDWRRARHFLRRLETLYGGHPVADAWNSRLLERAERQLISAEQARSAGDHRAALAHADSAAAIWPSTPNLRVRHRVYADRYQRLHVGVVDLPSALGEGTVSISHAADRAQRLQEVHLFEVDHADDGAAHYSTRFCDWWEPLNLGRQARFELRDIRQSWEMQPVVTAPVIAARIAARIDPSSPTYDERLAGYARSVDVHSPYSLTINFDRVPVRIEPLLRIPIVGPDSDAGRGRSVGESFAEDESSLVSFAGSTAAPTGGFQLAETTPEVAIYRRALAEPDDLRTYHLAEVQEHHYGDYDAALQGLVRGEVSMLVRPSASIVDLLRTDDQLRKSFFVAKMAAAATHVVQFHPRSRPLKNREYRRALAYGIDRPRILAETVLGSRSSSLGRVVNGPFPSRSEAVNALVQTRPYDPVAAVSLAMAARKQWGGELPALKMIVINDPVARAAAEELVRSWSRVGIAVEIHDLPTGPLVEDAQTEPAWDLLYRTVQLTDPTVQLWPFLTLTGRARLSDLDSWPDWLRQEIINLDLATDRRDALQAVNRLHLRLYGEVLLLPLWEVDEYLIYRKNVRGVPITPVHPYDEVDRWIVESWFPESLP